MTAARVTKAIAAVQLAAAAGALVVWGWLGSSPEMRGLSPFFKIQFEKHELVGALLAAALVAGLFVVLPQAAAARMVGWLAARPRTVAALATAAIAAAAYATFHGFAWSGDEKIMLMQAELFANGRLIAEYPPGMVQQVFPIGVLDRLVRTSWVHGTAVSGYMPGFSAMLTPFVAAGVPWLLNPLLAGASLLLMHGVARRLVGNAEAGGWAMLMALASPAFTLTASTSTAMTAHLCLNLLFTALVLTPTPARLLAAGAVGGFALNLHNPYPHLLFALPMLAWVARSGGRAWWRSWLLLVPGYAVCGAGIAFAWLQVFDLVIGADKIAKGVARPLAASFDLPSLKSVLQRTIDMMRLCIWAVPGLPVLAAIAWWRADRGSMPRALGWAAWATIAGFLLVQYDQWHGWGYRYFHSAWGVLPVLAAVVLGSDGCSVVLKRVGATLALASLLVVTPVRFYQARDFVAWYRAQDPCLPETVRQVCFVDPNTGFLTGDLVRNDAFLRGPRVILASWGRARDERVIAVFFPGATLVREIGGHSVWVLP